MARRKLGQLEAETLAVLAGQDRPVTIPALLEGLVGLRHALPSTLSSPV